MESSSKLDVTMDQRSSTSNDANQPKSENQPSLRQQNAQRLLFQFSKAFVSVMESTIFSKSDSDEDEDETDECFDGFESSYSSYSQLEQLQPVSDEDFAFEKYFPLDQKEYYRDLFISVALAIFQSYEYQLVMLVREKRKLCEIAEDIVHKILDNFKESQRGFNPDLIDKPEITERFLITLALGHTEPEGITYNSEWSAVEVLENPGIIIPFCEKNPTCPGHFYKSDWQKNFIGVKKKIGSKYGFRRKFDFETETTILKSFERVALNSVYPLYLQYNYCLNEEMLKNCRKSLEKELHIEDKMKKFGLIGEEKEMKDKVKEFQIKLQIQKQEEDKNSDKVMKQVVIVGQEKEEQMKNKLQRLEAHGVVKPEGITKARVGLLKSNYNVRFEVKESNACLEYPLPMSNPKK